MDSICNVPLGSVADAVTGGNGGSILPIFLLTGSQVCSILVGYTGGAWYLTFALVLAAFETVNVVVYGSVPGGIQPYEEELS
jgi:hypothetical protein